MPSLTNDRRKKLVGLLQSLGAGQAETNAEKIGPYLFPVHEHLRALDPDVVLVVGDRGAGKSQLKDVLLDPKLRNALVAQASRIRIPSGEVEWREAWPLGRGGPDSRSWRTFSEGASRADMVDAWLVYLLRLLRERIPVSAEMDSLADADALDLVELIRLFGVSHTHYIGAIDRLDEDLEKNDKWIFVSYDELDTVVFDDWKALGNVVQGLISMWASYARRWRRIRPKIFLRTDFYRHNREIAGADVVKLSANRVELSWSDGNLYSVLVKRILNRDESLADYFKNVISWEMPNSVLGIVPKLTRADDARRFIARLAGEYMGKTTKKGLTLTWLLDHLRDGTERLSPRVLLWLIEEAAREEADSPRAAGAQLIHHSSIRRALDRVSSKYVEQAMTSEFAWLHGLKGRLGAERKVPWSRRQLDALLRSDFGSNWGGQREARPPGDTVDEVRQNLLTLGVLRERGDGTFDVPDLYLHGLGLVRKGGVARE